MARVDMIRSLAVESSSWRDVTSETQPTALPLSRISVMAAVIAESELRVSTRTVARLAQGEAVDMSLSGWEGFR